MGLHGGFDEQSARRLAKMCRQWEARLQDVERKQTKNYSDGIFWQCFKNVSSETAPAYALMRDTTQVEIDAIGNICLKATKPDNTFSRRCLVNSSIPVPAGEYGLCRVGGLVEVLFDESDTPPGADEGCGPKPGSWKATRYYPQCLTVEGIMKNSNIVGHTVSARLDVINSVWGKWSADVLEGATETVLISIGNEAWTDSTMTLPGVRNIPADALSGDLVNVGWMNGKPEGYPRVCA